MFSSCSTTCVLAALFLTWLYYLFPDCIISFLAVILVSQLLYLHVSGPHYLFLGCNTCFLAALFDSWLHNLISSITLCFLSALFVSCLHYLFRSRTICVSFCTICLQALQFFLGCTICFIAALLLSWLTIVSMAALFVS